VIGGEQRLHGHPAEVERARHPAVPAAPELAGVELGELLGVELADAGVVEDHQVVEVGVTVGVGEVRRAGQQRRARAGAAAVVPDDELLVEDARVVVGADVHAVAQQCGKDVAIDVELARWVLPPLDPDPCILLALARPRVGLQLLVILQVVLLEDHANGHAAPAGIDQRLGDRQ
jgi:hypothetical protein